MEQVNICFFCINSSEKLYLCDVCILEQRMSNYNFQLCHNCMEKHRKYHSIVNEMSKLEMDLYIAKQGNFTGL